MITWIYANTIQPGAVAGEHWHLEHEVLVRMAYGELTLDLRAVDGGEKETVVCRASDHEMVTMPGRVFHAGRNASDKPCMPVMFASTQPRGEGDELH